MRKSTLVGGLAAVLASMVLVLPPPSASAAPPDGTGDLYSDLFVAFRDVDGVPFLTPTFYEEGPEEVACIQPISYAEIPSITSVVNPADGRDVYLVPLVGEGSTAVLPVEADTACDPQPAYLDYASEVELERLNLVRTSDAVLWRKLVEVETRLQAASEITLDGAGRITTDGAAIDASPEQAAIYAATAGDPPAAALEEGPPADPAKPGGLMDTGTIPGLGSSPAWIQQGDSPTDGFNNWMLAAAAVGTAAGKSVPITIDTIEYYNRIAAPSAELRPPDGGVDGWGYAPILPQVANGEEFVDFRGFSYNRSDVFTGCTTWLDVGTLTWKYDYVINRVEFTDVVEFADPTSTVANVAGFTQLADDVRSVIGYLHENDVVVNPETGEGFFIDPVFEESCAAQADKVVELNTPVDAVDPTVTITAAPTATTTATDATFAFTATDAASVLCVLDAGAFERCLSPKTYSGLEPGAHTFNVIAMGVAGNFASDTHTWQVVPPGEDSMIASFSPVRLADTRPGWVAADGLFVGTGPVPGGQFVQVSVANRGGVPADAQAAVLNVTIADPVAGGYATVYPCGTVPYTSSLNYAAGEAVANEVIAKLSPTGGICVFTNTTANIIVDVAGYVPALSDYMTLSPVRLADTRAGWVAADGLFKGTGPVPGGQFVQVPVAGRNGVPVDAKSVVANVTIADPVAGGYATVYPCGTVPYTSSLNYAADEAVANEVIAKLSPTGGICVFTNTTANIIVDVAGYM